MNNEFVKVHNEPNAILLRARMQRMNVGLGDVVNGQPLTCIAKWADILKLYELDKQNVLYCQLCKVTDRHLKYFAQDAMKVSLAAQVMSSTVAAAIDTHVTAGKEKYF